MGAILGLGMSHYPGPMVPDEYMSYGVRIVLESDRLPAALKDVRNWPAPMQAEWGQDEGRSAATAHRARLVDGYRRLRAELDAFQPDFIVMFGDDQYENFREDVIPPFCVYILSEVESRPFPNVLRRARSPVTVWGEPSDTVFTVRGHPDGAKYLVNSLLEAGFDMPYAYTTRPGNDRGLAHSFMQTLLYLDYDRVGFDYPLVPVHVNCYGSRVIRSRGGSAHLTGGGSTVPDPAGPPPWRCFAAGRATAQILRDSPWRVAIVGTSSWSHAQLTEKHSWLYPDVEADHARFEELQTGRFAEWANLELPAIEAAGQNELLNWVCLAGAMTELGYQAEVIDFVQTYVFNSSKCFAVFRAP
jgi:hypothetical protein